LILARCTLGNYILQDIKIKLTSFKLFIKFGQGDFSIATKQGLSWLNSWLSQKSHHFSLLSSIYPCELSEREVTSTSNLKVVSSAHPKYNLFYPLANEVAMGYSNATVRPSFLPSIRNILVNTLESTSFNGFWPNLVYT
jgi:hypothetical protein